MEKKKRNLIILSSGVGVFLVIAFSLVYFIRKSHQQEQDMSEMVEQMNFEKEQVQKEYSEMSHEFDGYTSNIKNDSLVQLLNNQKTKVQQLLDELRVTKVTNARRIAQLKLELASVRKVMIQYVNQIDSLNKTNHILRTENVEVKRKFQEASQTVEQLSKDKDNLNKVVTRASILEISGFSMTPLNGKGKKTGWFSSTSSLQFSFKLARNVTAQPGEKIIYLRITRPDDELLTKHSSGTFAYEDKQIAYSVSKQIEYTGEEMTDVMYWKVDEILPKGTYRAEFFADGHRIGSFSFKFEK